MIVSWAIRSAVGTVPRSSSGAVVQWSVVSGAVVQWCSGAVVQGCSGAVVQWCSGAVVQWCSGQWCSGAVVQWSVVQWCSGAVAQWCEFAPGLPQWSCPSTQRSHGGGHGDKASPLCVKFIPVLEIRPTILYSPPLKSQMPHRNMESSRIKTASSSPPLALDSDLLGPRLAGKRPTEVFVGYRKTSSEHDPRDRHAVYGTLWKNDFFRFRLVREHRNGRTVISNFPSKGKAGHSWVSRRAIIFEPHIAHLNPRELKEYCRIRQYQMDKGETHLNRRLQERKAVLHAQFRAGTANREDGVTMKCGGSMITAEGETTTTLQTPMAGNVPETALVEGPQSNTSMVPRPQRQQPRPRSSHPPPAQMLSPILAPAPFAVQRPQGSNLAVTPMALLSRQALGQATDLVQQRHDDSRLHSSIAPDEPRRAWTQGVASSEAYVSAVLPRAAIASHRVSIHEPLVDRQAERLGRPYSTSPCVAWPSRPATSPAWRQPVLGEATVWPQQDYGSHLHNPAQVPDLIHGQSSEMRAQCVGSAQSDMSSSLWRQQPGLRMQRAGTTLAALHPTPQTGTKFPEMPTTPTAGLYRDPPRVNVRPLAPAPVLAGQTEAHSRAPKPPPVRSRASAGNVRRTRRQPKLRTPMGASQFRLFALQHANGNIGGSDEAPPSAHAESSTEDEKNHNGITYTRTATGPLQGMLSSPGSIVFIDREEFVEHSVLLKPASF